ncbi:Inner membrane protein yjgN [Citrobacter amalonaticus]|nr:Inner membrane protein yjgN [Citrobacter amalonaticus]
MAALLPFLAVVGFIAIALFKSIYELDVTGMAEEEIEALILIEYQRQIVISQIIYYLGIAISMSYLIVAFRNHFLNNLQLADGHIRFRSTLTFHGMVYRLGGVICDFCYHWWAGVSTAAHVADYLAGEKYVRGGRSRYVTTC